MSISIALNTTRPDGLAKGACPYDVCFGRSPRWTLRDPDAMRPGEFEESDEDVEEEAGAADAEAGSNDEMVEEDETGEEEVVDEERRDDVAVEDNGDESEDSNKQNQSPERQPHCPRTETRAAALMERQRRRI